MQARKLRGFHLAGGRRNTLKGSIVQGREIGRGGQGVVEALEYRRGKHRVSLAEKRYHENPPSHKTTASQDYLTFKSLMGFLPRKLFPRTVRLKVNSSGAASLILTRLGLKGKKLMDLNPGRFIELPENHWPAGANSLLVLMEQAGTFRGIKNYPVIQKQIQTAVTLAAKNGWVIPMEAFTIELDPKTKTGSLYILDVGTIKRFRPAR
ncbi:MAG: hypothetical protein Q7S92_02205 [Candidatus Diapherotrites archaeon]|nr:hypothetical protein [Candidatus Diapherotrites archaeon]